MNEVYEALARELATVRGEALLVGDLVVAGVLVVLAWLVGRVLDRRARSRVATEHEPWWRPLFHEGVARRVVMAVALLFALDQVHLIKGRDMLAAFGALLDTHLFDLGGKDVTLGTVFTVVGVVTLSFWLSSVIQRRLGAALRAQGVSDQSTVAAGSRLTHYVVIVLGFGVGLQTAGIDLSALFAAGAVFAIGLGFAMQTLAQNFVAGVLLLVEGNIKPGDIVQANGKMVRVLRMGLRTTIVRDTDDVEAIVPNSDLVVNQVQHYTLSDRQMRVRAKVGVAYSSDLQVVHAALLRAAASIQIEGLGPGPRVLLTQFGDSSVDFEVSIWINDPWALPVVRSALYFAIWDALAADGVVIAFPQLDVHFDAEARPPAGAPPLRAVAP